MTVFVTSSNFLKLKKDLLSLLTSINLGRAILAKLHTATSSGDVYSIISQQRLLERIVPKLD